MAFSYLSGRSRSAAIERGATNANPSHSSPRPAGHGARPGTRGRDHRLLKQQFKQQFGPDFPVRLRDDVFGGTDDRADDRGGLAERGCLAATRETLVQDGSQFATVLKAQASSAQSEAAGASVQKVTLTSATQAAVGYTILISGSPVLAGQKGTAVLESGTWKVSLTSFCGLLALQNGGKAVAGCPAS
jgi:hypothetical protein